MIRDRRSRVPVAALALVLVLSSLGLAPQAVASGHPRAVSQEGPDNDVSNNDDFLTAQEIANDTFMAGTTGLGDVHRIDMYVLKDVPSGMIINASLEITNFDPYTNRQAVLVEGWNKFHMEHLAWSNREDQPVRRQWEAISLLCVVSGDYYISLKPIAGPGTTSYTLHVRSFDAPDVTGKVGTGGAFGQVIAGRVASDKWYPQQWYKFQLTGDWGDHMNQYFYANLTVPGAPDERLLADLYVRNLAPETFSYWLNHSWWLDSFCQYEEVHAAACCPGKAWYFLTVEAVNSTGGRSEDFELRMTTLLIEGDGDDHPKVATPVTYESGQTTVRRYGNLTRGPDMFDWYKTYLYRGDDLKANLTLLEKSTAIFRLSIFRDNLTSPYPEQGYDLMSSWTNKPAETVLNRVSALTTNVMQEGWYYIGVIAQIGLVPCNISNLCDWTVQTAWARYQLDLSLPDHTQAPFVSNPLSEVSVDEDTAYSGIRLLDSGENGGIFSDPDLAKEWGDELDFAATADPELNVLVGNDAEATVTLGAGENWNGDASVTFTATDRYGKKAQCRVTAHVLPTEDGPVVKARLPDFSVTEGTTNETMTGIDLYDCFSDPDLSPFGQDSLTFSIDNGSFPATLSGSALDFGQSPDYPGFTNTTVTVTVTATDRASQAVSDTLVITVIDKYPGGIEPLLPPVFDAGAARFEFRGEQASTLDLDEIFSDPQGEPLEFSYLGGASPNLSVALEPDGTVRLTPAPEYVSAVETLTFRAIAASGKTTDGTLTVKILNLNAPPRFVLGSLVPDPASECRVSEGRPITFSFSASDVDDEPSALSCRWYVDGAVMGGLAGWTLTWTPAYDMSGPRVVKAEVTDGHVFVQALWSVLVQDVNRPPVITGAWPASATAARPGSPVQFSAAASDPDGDPLEFTWSLPDGTVLKRETGPSSTFGRAFRSGEDLTIILRVSDGKGGEDTHAFNVIVPAATITPDELTVDDPSGIQLAAAVFVVVIAGSVAALWLIRRKR